MVHGQLSRDVGLFLRLGAGAGVAASATRSQGDATWKPGFRSWRFVIVIAIRLVLRRQFPPDEDQ
jgi:hypothetical protein